MATLDEHVHVVAEAVGHRLEDGTEDVAAAMAQREPRSCRARPASKMGVFSPRKYGRITRPSAPGGVTSASASRRA